MLDCTPKEPVPEGSHTIGKINPVKTCQPIGAMYAALGIHRCLPHSHGSQGCCSYHRMALSRHFHDPAMASTSSFTEGASVFGGAANLKTSIKNVFQIYDPDIIAVHTTCLSETIGDDIPAIIKQSEIPEGKYVIHCNTPSYDGSHVTGFSNMCKGIVNYLAEADDAPKKEQVNIFPGYVNPGDMREIQRIVTEMGIKSIMYPDTTNVMDSPMMKKYEMYPMGGAKIEDIKDSGNSKMTIALGAWSSAEAAAILQSKCKVQGVPLKIPIGVKATDEMIMALKDGFDVEVPLSLEIERGQVIDTLLDIHFQYEGKKVAVYGDPDIVIPLTELLITMGMIPKYIITGTNGKKFEQTINSMLEEAGIEGSKIKAEGDLFDLHQWIKEESVDLLIGNSHGKYIARAEDIPLVRVGFPVYDRAVHPLMPITGYRGCLRLIEMISNTLLDRRDHDALDQDYELIL
ncbi:MAG: nitrogenase molybdenum-iron protein subunit beta [Methanomicrobiaceae archaeon]|nr:nitrogenase molybdenum-iron protein subunit beta [Methanomicrobiaceae archaeon]